ncbi:MAG: hypothetical protein ACRDAX_03145 [Propionibacteriaceae bacterium]
MRRKLKIPAIIVMCLYGALQLLLGVTMFSRHIPIALVFLAAGLLVIAGALTSHTVIVFLGLVCSIAAPLWVGLAGVEPFEIIHHVVRIAVVTALATFWFIAVRRSPSRVCGASR